MVVWLAHCTSDLMVCGLRPKPCHRVVSSDEKPYSALCLLRAVPPFVTCIFLRISGYSGFLKGFAH